MAQPGIILEGFGNFHWTANPEQVKFGLKEQIVIHKMIGGARILDMMGDDPEDISWSGFFLGPDSVGLAQALYALQQGKDLLELTFGLYNATVVIASLDLTYKKAFWIDYSITCVVVDQAVGTALGGAAGAAINVNAGAGDPAILAANVALNQINTVFDAAQGVFNGIGGLALGAGLPAVGILFQ